MYRCSYCEGQVEIMPDSTEPAICRQCGLKHEIVRIYHNIKLRPIDDIARLTEEQLERLRLAREVRRLQIEHSSIEDKNTHYSTEHESTEVATFGKAFGVLLVSGALLSIIIYGKLETTKVVVIFLIFLAVFFVAVRVFLKALEIHAAKGRLEQKEAELRKYLDGPK